jgi:hypothetical protein
MEKRPKEKDLLLKISDSVNAGMLLYSNHANDRMLERKILKPDVEQVLLKGYHEAKKDQFNVALNSWDYAIRGKSIDGKNLRIVIALIKPNVLVVTTIDLDQ